MTVNPSSSGSSHPCGRKSSGLCLCWHHAFGLSNTDRAWIPQPEGCPGAGGDNTFAERGAVNHDAKVSSFLPCNCFLKHSHCWLGISPSLPWNTCTLAVLYE